MKVCRTVFLIFLSFVALLMPTTARATEPNAKGGGLYISPLRRQLAVTAGQKTAGDFTVGNLTDKPMAISLIVKQFSVTNHTYDYRFRPVEYEWISFDDAQRTLQPGERTKITYNMAIPPNAAAGGYYFALFAVAPIAGQGIQTTLQAATLLYLAVDGDKANHSLALENETIPAVATDPQLTYKFDAHNMGNIHVDGHFFAQLDGAFGTISTTSTDRLVLPNTYRTIRGALKSPILPGIYKLTYGYTMMDGRKSSTRTIQVLFIPIWSIVAVIPVVLGIVWLWQHRRGS